VKNYLICALIFGLLFNALEAQEVIEIWPDQVPGEYDMKHEAISKTDGGVTRLSDVNNPLMKVYKPMKEMDNGHSIIICPGGGYHILAIDLEGSEIAYWLSDLGFTAYVLEYRVPQKPEFALMDAQRAIRIVKTRTVKNKKIGILGFSAGGHLSATVSTTLEENSYDKIDTLDELRAKPDFTVLIYPAYLDRGGLKNLSPEIRLGESTPPMFIFMTADDPYVNSSFMMAHALMKNNTPVEFHIYPEGGHGYGLRKSKSVGVIWPKLCEIWLKKQIE
jgi:acetyl esterase/lipase